MTGGDLSFSWWGHFDNFYTYSRIFDFGDGQRNDNLLLYNHANTGQIRTTAIVGSGNVADLYTSTISADNDYHIVAVMSHASNLIEVYINGASVGSGGVSGAIPTITRTKHWLGRSNWQSADDYFDGWMQAFSVYKRVLSASDVTDLYDKGTNNPCYVLDGRPINVMCKFGMRDSDRGCFACLLSP